MVFIGWHVSTHIFLPHHVVATQFFLIALKNENASPPSNMASKYIFEIIALRCGSCKTNPHYVRFFP